MAGSIQEADEEISSINVTPLVDIVLVLLIIFMVTAKLMASPAVPLDLPEAATGEEAQVVFLVTVDAQGAITTDGHPLEGERELQRRAREALRRHPDLRTVIQASKAAPHGLVIHVLDRLRAVGIRKVAFGVEVSR